MTFLNSANGPDLAYMRAQMGSASFGSKYLRKTRMLLENLLLQADVSLNISVFGDSWSKPSVRWTGGLASNMATKYGNSIGGWVGFGFSNLNQAAYNGHALFEDYPIAYTGTWTSAYNSSWRSPDFCRASGAVDSYLTVGFPAGHSGATFVYDAASDGTVAGSVAYSFDTGSGFGAETVIDLTGNWGGYVELIGVPATAGTLKIRVVSLNNRLDGVYFKSSVAGVRVNKLAGDGNSMKNVGEMTASLVSQWNTSLGLIDTDLFVYLFGTNDQQFNRTGEQFEADLTAFIARTKTVKPSADHLIVMPCENLLPAKNFPMSTYRDAAARVAIAKKTGFLDLQPLFGDAPSEYAFGAPRSWFSADNAHPDPATGGKVILSGIRRMIEQGSV